MIVVRPLEKWLDDTREKRTDFARRIGCSLSHLTLVAQGKRGASLELALAIERETDGAVTAQQIFEGSPKDRNDAGAAA